MTDDASTVPATAVVCTRGRDELLERVIRPLGAAVEALPGAELIIVQQGSGDAEAVCRRAAVGALVINDDGIGASRARNLGWRRARGAVVAFTDDDCAVPEEWLVDHVDALRDPGVVVSCGQVSGLPRYGGESTEVWDRTAVRARHRTGDPPWEIGHSANLAVRRDALAAVGGFDERFGPGAPRVSAGEDADVLARLLEVGDAWSGVGEPVRHLPWRAAADDERALVDYEVGAGAWMGKLAVRHPRVALSLLRARLRMLETSSPWSDRRTAMAHRAALSRGFGLGLLLGLTGGRSRAVRWKDGTRMSARTMAGMRAYWDTRAKENAPWYVDTSLSFDDPDMEQFWRQGERIVAIALDEPPAIAPARRGFAVEIGAGLGRNCKALLARFDRVVGVDIAPEMVRRAAELVPEVAFQLVDGASLAPIADGSADLVLSFTVFQHIPDVAVIERYLDEAGRVLRPGGVLTFQWNNEPGHRLWTARRLWLTALDRVGVRRERYRRHAPQFLGSRVPLARIERALIRAGLELEATRDLGTLYAWAWARKQ